CRPRFVPAVWHRSERKPVGASLRPADTPVGVAYRQQCGRPRPELRQILSGGPYIPRDLAVECVRSLMMEPLRPRAKYVIGPDGSPLTIADLPAPGTKRWVIRRKAEVVAAVRGGLLSLEEACSRYTLTVEEFLSWQYSIDQPGLPGLGTTRIQQYRQ